jgi:hypothetical protein
MNHFKKISKIIAISLIYSAANAESVELTEQRVLVSLEGSKSFFINLTEEKRANACYPEREKCDPTTDIPCCGWSECVDDYPLGHWCEPDPY